MYKDLDLAALLCSRLCHDLISPVGAVGNGLELLEAEGGVDPEVRRLLNDSARSAQASLAFFRIAFGAVGAPGAVVSTQELGRVAHAYFASGRHTLAWPASGDALPRPVAKILLLMLMAAATAAPIGGSLSVAQPVARPMDLSVAAAGPRAGLSPEAVALMTGADASAPMAPRDAPLSLLARLTMQSGAQVTISQGTESTLIDVRAIPG